MKAQMMQTMAFLPHNKKRGERKEPDRVAMDGTRGVVVSRRVGA